MITGPSNSHGGIVDAAAFLLPGGGLGIGFHVFKDEASHEDGGILGGVGLVDIAVGKDISHSLEDRVVLGGRFVDAAAGLALVIPPVTDPLLAKNPLAETTELSTEGMGASAETGIGMPRLQASSKCL